MKTSACVSGSCKRVEVQGTPIEAHSTKMRHRTAYSVTVTYLAGGIKFTQQLPVEAFFYRRLGSDGALTLDTVPVRYAQSDPNVAMIVGGSSLESDGMLVIGSAFAFGGLVYLLYQLLRNRRFGGSV